MLATQMLGSAYAFATTVLQLDTYNSLENGLVELHFRDAP